MLKVNKQNELTIRFLFVTDINLTFKLFSSRDQTLQ